MKILVLDGTENQAVACVRSLAAAGHNVRVGSPSSISKAGWSRYSAGSFRYVSPEESVSDFLRDIVAEVKRFSGALVLPMTERTTLPLSGARQQITDAGGAFFLPAHSTVLRAFDKSEMTNLAVQLGVEVPRTWSVSGCRDAEGLSLSLPYPVVLKPQTSNEIASHGAIQSTGRPLYASDADQFLMRYAELKRHCSSMLIQEYVEGRGAGYFAFMSHGELRSEFAHMRLRDVWPTGSGSALRVSVQPDPKLREAALLILKALKWHGVAMVEFRIRPNGTPVFIEVNGRFWNSLALAVYAGVDFPALLVEATEFGDVAPRSGYRLGIRCRWLLGDFRHLVEVMRGVPAGFPGDFPKRWPTFRGFITPIPGTFHDNFTLDDPLPEVADWLHFFCHRVPEWINSRELRRKTVHA